MKKGRTSHKSFTATFAITAEGKFLKPHILFSALKKQTHVWFERTSSPIESMIPTNIRHLYLEWDICRRLHSKRKNQRCVCPAPPDYYLPPTSPASWRQWQNYKILPMTVFWKFDERSNFLNTYVAATEIEIFVATVKKLEYWGQCRYRLCIYIFSRISDSKCKIGTLIDYLCFLHGRINTLTCRASFIWI